MPLSRSATKSRPTCPMMPDRKHAIPITSAACARAACGTELCGKEAPMKRYAGQKICSCVDTTDTLPVGSISRFTLGDPVTIAGHPSITPPRSIKCALKEAQLGKMAGAANPMRRASERRSAASTAPTASLCRASDGGSLPFPSRRRASTGSRERMVATSTQAWPRPLCSSSIFRIHRGTSGFSTMTVARLAITSSRVEGSTCSPYDCTSGFWDWRRPRGGISTPGATFTSASRKMPRAMLLRLSCGLMSGCGASSGSPSRTAIISSSSPTTPGTM
mmetsp:Transcript_21430/g.46996  ORF Transcript_21430/g.46996 Transcript_21430/m.46996 type:complete len:276 (-) Transcript_21430:1007-1834(-)